MATDYDIVIEYLINKKYSQDQIDLNLIYSIKHGRIDLVKLFLDFGANVKATDDKNDTALHWSVFKNLPIITKLLIDKDADINVIGLGDLTPLDIAIQNKRKKILEILISKLKDYKNLYRIAIVSNNYILLKTIIKIKKPSFYQFSDKTEFVLTQNTKTLQILIKHFLNLYPFIKLSNPTSVCPDIIDAAKHNNFNACKQLLKYKIDINVTDTNTTNINNTALIHATTNQNYQLIKLLIKKGANIYHMNNYHCNAINISYLKNVDNNLISNKIFLYIQKEDIKYKLLLFYIKIRNYSYFDIKLIKKIKYNLRGNIFK